MVINEINIRGGIYLVPLVGLFLRWCVALHSYSGEQTAPMFGDYEAQRHWMEITYNLPLKDWYYNTSDNNLLYWGLDYPPLTAYHSLLNGYSAAYFNAEFVELNSSRGYESPSLKFFMRCTVLIADMLVFFFPIMLYFTKRNMDYMFRQEKKNRVEISPLLCAYLALIYPGIILIDHGHFQYNCISLGLMLASVGAIIHQDYIVSSILFSVAINYKQMELYHSLPFFFFFLGDCLSMWKTNSFKASMKRFSTISFAVIITFVVIWLPFLVQHNQLHQVLTRLFPISRGVFEDKVANIWCSLNTLHKFRLTFSNEQMVKICMGATFLAVMPSSVNLFFHPTVYKLKLSLINSSLAFFLFSFQVHEKSILLAAVPAIIYFPFDPFPCFWFLNLTVFSMLPLLMKDRLVIPFLALSLFYFFSVKTLVGLDIILDNFVNCSIVNNPAFYHSPLFTWQKLSKKVITSLFVISLCGCVSLILLIIGVNPPSQYPDLYPVLISVYTCFHFVIFFLYFNYKQLYFNCSLKNE